VTVTPESTAAGTLALDDHPAIAEALRCMEMTTAGPGSTWRR
jgi:hypothetical protein